MANNGFEPQLSVARRTPDLEDYVDMLRRQKAWIIGPTFAALVIAVVVAHLWPDTYVSTAVVRVVPPQVPEAFVPTNVNLEMSQRINSMAQQILSRSTLTNIINTYGLYPRDRARLPMEDVVENMRRNDVRISNVVSFTTSEGKRQVPAFQISFAYENRMIAQKVCQDLVSRFINENQRDRANQSTFTTQFLKDQLELARRDLEAVEDKLAAFRIRNAGRLPDQVQQNMQQLTALEQRLTNLNGTLSRINQEKLLLESQLQIYKDQLKSVGSTTEQVNVAREQAKNERLIAYDREITNMETQIAALRENYRDSHPDMQRALAALKVLKAKRDALAKEEESKKPAEEPKPKTVVNPQAIREARELEAAIRKVQSAIEAKDLELEETRKEVARVDNQIRATQARIDATPLGEKEYLDLLRDRDLARQRVEELNRKKSISAVATDLENRQQGENLELLDPASMPQKPSEPDRPLLIGAGVGIGLVIGLLLAAARELKDTSLKNLKDVRAYTNLDILGSIPLLENDLVVRRRRRLAWLAWSTACIVGVLIMSGSMYYYYFVVRVA
ncbi:MAG: Wzz/FepE/Etk N-terminal domain-containing protein [Bryobacteraceae bacterium]|nr:Wzz/FepE/Etk N-terminal domain-containing protein [Bryobacteraceae bacterium]MDW8379729.1 Wzz/FepE/Etk N-terminal domain-containing protein [Bryobacterales bacterium]